MRGSVLSGWVAVVLATSLACGGDLGSFGDLEAPVAPPPAPASDPKAALGDGEPPIAPGEVRPFAPAPPLGDITWVKGEPVDLLHGVAVVEHWATWCGPCRDEFPHLSYLADAHEDVTVVSLSDEPAGVVRPFLTRHDAEMGYRVGVGDVTAMARWAERAGATGIPHAYLLVDGNLVWSGHPQGLDDVIEPVLAGTWTPEAAAAVGQLPGLHDAYVRGASAGSADAAIGARFEAAWVPTSAQNNLAWAILTEVPEAHRDLPLALRLSTSACERTGRTNYGFEDTYALALYESGDHDAALATQREAVRRCDAEGGDCGELRDRLTRFGG
jgi:thiol-disulfide isomerase/thioredoxin